MATEWAKLGLTYKSKGSEEIANFEVETESHHSFKDLVKRVFEWLQNEEYLDIQTDKDDKYEMLYWEKQYAAHKEHQIWWRAYKQPVKDIENEYVFYYFKITFQTIRVAKGETVYKGRKYKTDEANAIVRVKSFLIVNDEHWENKDQLFSSFLKVMKPRFKSLLYKDKLEHHRRTLMEKTFQLQNTIKEFLGENTNQELPPNIIPIRGLT